jgi:hypothetical protein
VRLLVTRSLPKGKPCAMTGLEAQSVIENQPKLLKRNHLRMAIEPIRFSRRPRSRPYRGQTCSLRALGGSPSGTIWLGAAPNLRGSANRYRPPLGSFGLGASRGPIVTDYQWVRLVSGPRGGPIVTDPHWVRLVSGLAGSQSLQTPIGFVWSRGLAGSQSLQLAIGFVWSRDTAGGQSLQTTIGFVWSRGVG